MASGLVSLWHLLLAALRGYVIHPLQNKPKRKIDSVMQPEMETTFDLTVYQADCAELHNIYDTFFNRVDASMWTQSTGGNSDDWTLHQTLAHVVSVAESLNQVIEAVQQDQQPDFKGITRPSDLVGWNRGQIAQLSQHPPSELITRLLASVKQAAQYAGVLSAEQLTRKIDFPAYNRPAPLVNLLHWQHSHTGIVHAAQLGHGANMAPFWEQYSEPLFYRQIERFLCQFSYIYRSEPDDDLRSAMNFQVGDDWQWFIVAAPDGGTWGDGFHPDAPITLLFTDGATLCNLFTQNESPMVLFRRGQVTLKGDLREFFTLLRRYNPTPDVS